MDIGHLNLNVDLMFDILLVSSGNAGIFESEWITSFVGGLRVCGV